MALDKQRILSELGSVMNQLKSADCGCMGKLFGQSAQGAASTPGSTYYGGCRQKCYQGHGYGWNSNGSCGEPCNAQNMYTPCMGRCNPSKLYADTYNYLTDNLMQPTVKEVYDDLKSLTPENTIVNNSMAAQMGLSNRVPAQDGNMGDMTRMTDMNAGNIGNMNAENMGVMQVGNMGNVNAGNMGNMNAGNMVAGNYSGQTTNAGSILTNKTNPNQLGGMGPQIMNMLGGNITSQNKAQPTGHNVSLTQPMLIDAPQSPHGQIGVTPINTPMQTNPNVFNAQVNPRGYNVNQGMLQPNMQSTGIFSNIEQPNPAAQQMASGHQHGPHSKGMAKFNEMFPGVMNNLGGDLGFDPMAIAIQMNPANQQQAAINSMKNLMQKNKLNQVFNQSANTALIPGKGAPQNKIQNNLQPNQAQQSIPVQQIGNETVQPNATLTNQMTYQTATNNNSNVYGNPSSQLNSQQVYTAGVPVPVQQTEQADQQRYQVPQQNIVDPNTESEMALPTLSSTYEENPNQQNLYAESPNIQRMIKEPIFPVDTSGYIAPKKPKFFEFNTLGQPIEKTSAERYRTPEPSLPQTLSPQPVQAKLTSEAAKYSKVKSTISKTSLMGAKAVGRTPSQLQHIYNQYKGSQSFTQQNIPAPGVNAVTHSEGKLTASQVNQLHRQMPVERVGGDTVANNQMQDQRTVKVESIKQQIGDVPTAVKPIGTDKTNDVVAPVINRKPRNGLQDMVYTSYPSSAAWSFHGANTRPYSPSRGRYRGRYR